MRDRLMIFDLDGTLFDTKEVNFHAYNKALEINGFQNKLSYDFYCSSCNGDSYKVFLPKIVSELSKQQIHHIHEKKKQLYSTYLKYAKINNSLINLIKSCKNDYQVCIVTSASKKNVEEILAYFGIEDLFDFIISQEDVVNPKPSPEGFNLAIDKANVKKENTLIFEDSAIGLCAAEKSGANYVQVYGFN